MQGDNYLYVDGIPGWFDFQEYYCRLAHEVPSGEMLVEVGTWLGCSAAFLGKQLIAQGKCLNVRVLCVDTWEGTPGKHNELVDKLGGVERTMATCQDNLNKAGVLFIVSLLRGKSHEVANFFRNGGLWSVFLDGDHSYESVCRDIAMWYPKVKSGGYFGGHDYFIDSVKQAVAERVGQVETLGTVWFKRVE